MNERPLNRNQAKRLIVELMLDGGIGPDTPISERSLAERTGLGRTPVREALRDLERDGLIDIEPKRGSFVRQLGLDDVREIFEVRFAMETLAASLAAIRGPSQRLRRIYEELSNFQGKKLTEEENNHAHLLGREMHGEIVVSSGNGLLESQYSQVRLMIEVSLGLTARREVARHRDILDEHVAISSAILASDSNVAQEAMRDHLLKGYQFRIQILTEFPAFVATMNLGGQPES